MNCEILTDIAFVKYERELSFLKHKSNYENTIFMVWFFVRASLHNMSFVFMKSAGFPFVGWDHSVSFKVVTLLITVIQKQCSG